MTAAHLSVVESDGETFADELPPGTELLQGQYRITRFLSAGGFGITYLARNSLDRNIVIKECFPAAFCRRVKTEVQARSRSHHDDLVSIVRLFVEEARSLAKLVHPNIVGVHQVFEENNTAYMSLDFIEGRDLLDALEDKGWQADPAEITTILRKLLDAIGFVHAEGMLHRDISPDNVLIQPDGEPILIDFGAAREQASKQSRVLSALRVVKDGYSPQEFYISGAEQGPPSDIYALGATLYHAITRELPPDSQTRLGAVAGQGDDPYVSLVGRVKGYDRAVLTSIDQALALMPRDRLQSAQEWLDVLDRKRGRVSRAMSRTVSPQTKPAAPPAKTGSGNSAFRVLLGSAAVVALVAGIAATQLGLIGGDVTDRSGDGPALATASSVVPRLAAPAVDESAPARPDALTVAAPLLDPGIRPMPRSSAGPLAPAREQNEAATPPEMPSISLPMRSAPTPAAPQGVTAPDTGRPPATRMPPAPADLADRADGAQPPVLGPSFEAEPAPALRAVAQVAAAAQGDPLTVGALRPRPRPAELAPVRLGRMAPPDAPLSVAASAVAAAAVPVLPLPLVRHLAETVPHALTTAVFSATRATGQVSPADAVPENVPTARSLSRSPTGSAAAFAVPAPAMAVAPRGTREVILGEDVTREAPQLDPQSRVSPGSGAPGTLSGPRETVRSAWSVDLPFALDSDVPVVSVNGVRIASLREIEPTLRDVLAVGDRTEVPVAFGVRDPATGDEQQQVIVLPVVHTTVLGNGMTFETRFDGEVWRTVLSVLPSGVSPELKPGDHFVAHLQSDRIIDGRTTLGDLVSEAVALGTTAFSFAVSRGGQMWVSSFQYEASGLQDE